MKEFITNLVLSLWNNHRKKVIAFVLGLLFAGIAAVSGIPLSEIQDAAKDAASKPAPAPVVQVLAPQPAQLAPAPVVAKPAK